MVCGQKRSGNLEKWLVCCRVNCTEETISAINAFLYANPSGLTMGWPGM